MSTSVASSAVGLLDRHYSPPSLREDAMDLDQSGEAEHAEERSKDLQMKTGESGVNSDPLVESDRHDAIGDLLAALATSATAKNAQTLQRRSVTPPAGTPLSQTSDAQLLDEGAPEKEEQEQPAPKEATPLTSADLSSANTDANNLDNQAAYPLIPSDPVLTMPTEEQFEAALAQDDMEIAFPSLDVSLDQFPTSPVQHMPINVRRQIDAYARLEFADGTFYLNTFHCELGRDQHAFRDALKREQEAKEAAEAEKEQPKSSSGRASQRSQVLKAESQVQGSVVSEAGGFAGVDEKPVDSFDKRNSQGQDANHNSSHASESDVVRPAEVLHNPSLAPYDYHKDIVYQTGQFAAVPEDEIVETERPAPVTLEHMPDPNSCPLIPIHTTVASEHTEVQNLRAISRRHVRIFWNWDESAFFMEVLGRNGAFFEDQHMKRGEAARLHSGAKIQISAVEFVFRLPVNLAEAESEDEDSNAASDEALEAQTTPNENGQTVKLKLRLNTDVNGAQAVGANGELKRRGPGRPPKNGIMSQREMKEREKAEKEAKARATSGIPSPPALERKYSKTQTPRPELSPELQKNEKRKYTKRKREDGEEEEVLPSIEAQDEVPLAQPLPPPVQLLPQQQQPPPPKRARTKSYSPEYRPFEKCTQEDLARPPHNYAVLLYMVLSETGEITLRQIYKQMQARWPFFKYCVESDGWTSSVRHNLNQEVGKLFERGRKEGKGFTWLPKPNAMEEYQAQKNKRSNAPPQPKPRPPPQQRPSLPPAQGQQLTWQNSGPNGQPKGPPPQGWQPNKAGQAGQTSSGATHNTGMTPAQARDPNYVPPAHMLHHHFGRPAPKFMPVTFEGLAVIHRFEQSMFQNLKQDTETQAKWRAIFHSAKQQALHGAKASLLPGGESDEEATILKHIRNFVERYKNPAFAGFGVRTASPATPTVAAAATTIAPSNTTPQSTPHATTVVNAIPSTTQAQQSTPTSSGKMGPSAAPQQQQTQGAFTQPSVLPTDSPQVSVAQSDHIDAAPSHGPDAIKGNASTDSIPNSTSAAATVDGNAPASHNNDVKADSLTQPEAISGKPAPVVVPPANGASLLPIGSPVTVTTSGTNAPPMTSAAISPSDLKPSTPGLPVAIMPTGTPREPATVPTSSPVPVGEPVLTSAKSQGSIENELSQNTSKTMPVVDAGKNSAPLVGTRPTGTNVVGTGPLPSAVKDPISALANARVATPVPPKADEKIPKEPERDEKSV